MAITMSFENLGQLVIGAGQTVGVTWELFADELPPLIGLNTVFGFDSGRHIVRVSAVDHEGPGGGMAGQFHYFATNVSTGPAQVVAPQHYVFFKAN